VAKKRDHRQPRHRQEDRRRLRAPQGRRDLDGPAFPLFEEAVKLGRERGDILFPEDGYVSGQHCQLSAREGQVFLKDMGSSNGTFLRVRENRQVPSGSLMLMGQQLFRVAYK